MVKDPVAARYAGALFELVKREGRVAEASDDCAALLALFTDHAELRQLLVNPGVEGADKLAVLERLLSGSWSTDVRAGVQLVLSLGRAAYLGEILEAFQELVDADRGLLRVTVRTARPLPNPLKARIKQTLERLEHRTVELAEETAPALLGGIQVFLGHQIIDGSLSTKLAELRQRLKRVRVH